MTTTLITTAGNHSSHLTPVTGTLAVQNGHLMFSGYIAAKDCKNFKADRQPTGYQRAPKPIRRNAIWRFYSDPSNMMPNGLLLNLRDKLESLMGRIEFVGGDEQRVKKAIAEGGNLIVHVVLYLDEDEIKWLVDGQHRYEYFIKPVINGDADAFLDMPIPVTITLGLTRAQERINFSFVNDEAKGVPKTVRQANLADMIEDGSNAFVRKMHDITDADLKAGAITGAWEYDGYEILKRLRDKPGVWTGNVILDLGTDQQHNDYLLQSPQFSRSLTPIISGNAPSLVAGILGLPYLTTDAVGDLLAGYWDGISKVYPEAFPATIKERKKYAIQKGQGVYPFHRLLVNVIAPFVSRYDAKAVYDGDKWAEFLAPVAEIKGMLADEEEVTGSDFWLSGQKGAAGSYSGDAGRKRLYLMLKHRIDEVVLSS